MAQYPHRYIRCPWCGDEYYHPDQHICSGDSFFDTAVEEGIRDSLSIFKQFREGEKKDDEGNN